MATEASKIYMKQWRVKNRQHVRAKNREWYENNRERAYEHARRWRASNPEKARESVRKSIAKRRQRDPAKYLAYRREIDRRYRVSHPERRQEIVLKHREKYPARHLLRYTRSRAAKYGREFTLTERWIQERLAKGCELTGFPFDMARTNGHKRRVRGPSIDRIDCTKGYTPDNCRLICVALNLGIQEWGLEESKALWRAVLAREEE